MSGNQRTGVSLADLSNGKAGRPRAPLDDLLPNVRGVLDRVGDVAEAKAAGLLIRGVMGDGEGGGGSSVKDVTSAVKDIHEIVTGSQDRADQIKAEAHAREQEALARQDEAATRRVEIETNKELGTAKMIVDALTTLTANGNGSKGGLDLAAVATIITAVTPLLTAMLDGRKGPDDSPMREYLRDLRDEVRSLREKVHEGTAKGTDLDSVVGVMSKLQGMGMGGMMAPGDRIALAKVETERELGLHGLNLQYGAQRAESEANGQMWGTVSQALIGGGINLGGARGGGGGGGSGGQEPAPAAAAQRYQLRCGACGHTWYGMPSDKTTCPKCGTVLEKKAS